MASCRQRFGVAVLLFAVFLSASAAPIVYEIGIPFSYDDPKREQLLDAARHAAELAKNESLAGQNAELKITYALLDDFSVEDPLAQVTLTNSLITPQLVAAFDATDNDVKLTSFLLANRSVCTHPHNSNRL